MADGAGFKVGRAKGWTGVLKVEGRIEMPRIEARVVVCGTFVDVMDGRGFLIVLLESMRVALRGAA